MRAVRAALRAARVRLAGLRQAVPVAPNGVVLLALAVAALATGWWLGWFELLVVALWCAVALLVTAPLVLGRLPADVGVSVTPARVMPGDTASGHVVVRNERGRALRAITLDVPVGTSGVQIPVPRLAAGQQHEQLVTIPARRRGLIQLGPARSFRGDPLGLWRRSITGRGRATLIVHPKFVSLDGAAAGFLRDLEGQSSTDLSSADISFHALREYTPGDDRRHVHWRSTAKLPGDTLLVRQYEDTRRAAVALGLVTTTGDYLDEEEFELAVSLAASVGRRAVRERQRLLFVAGERVLPVPTTTRLLDACAAVQAVPGGSGLMSSAQRLDTRREALSIAVLVTGSQASPAALRSAVNRLSTRTRVVVLRAERGGEAGYGRMREAVVVSVGQLHDLPAALRQGALL